MSNQITAQFIGFALKTMVREYTFTVREPSTEPREFTLTIVNEAFNAHRVRYQEGPDVCSLKLRYELAANANHPAKTHFDITDIDLEDYRSSHTPRSRSLFARRHVEDF
jgi:hypothetical protein